MFIPQFKNLLRKYFSIFLLQFPLNNTCYIYICHPKIFSQNQSTNSLNTCLLSTCDIQRLFSTLSITTVNTGKIAIKTAKSLLLCRLCSRRSKSLWTLNYSKLNNPAWSFSHRHDTEHNLIWHNLKLGHHHNCIMSTEPRISCNWFSLNSPKYSIFITMSTR